MNKNLIKLALIGLAAGMCVSAKAAPKQKNQEVAFSKCSKEESNRKCDQSCGAKPDKGCGSSTSAGRNNYSGEKYVPKKTDIAGKRKSAAQKVMEGY